MIKGKRKGPAHSFWKERSARCSSRGFSPSFTWAAPTVKERNNNLDTGLSFLVSSILCWHHISCQAIILKGSSRLDFFFNYIPRVLWKPKNLSNMRRLTMLSNSMECPQKIFPISLNPLDALASIIRETYKYLSYYLVLYHLDYKIRQRVL